MCHWGTGIEMGQGAAEGLTPRAAPATRGPTISGPVVIDVVERSARSASNEVEADKV